MGAIYPLDAVTPVFDVYDDDLMHDLMGKRIGKAAQELLIARRTIEITQASFGADPLKVLEMLLPLLDKFHEAAKEEWSESL